MNHYKQNTDAGLIPVETSATKKAVDAKLRSMGLIRKGKGRSRRAMDSAASNPEAVAAAAYDLIRARLNFRTTQAADGGGNKQWSVP